VSATEPIVSMIGSGSGSAPAMLVARALLVGNGVAHRWIDTDSDPVGRALAEHARLGAERPVAVFADGSQLPSPTEFVERRPVRFGHEREQVRTGPEQRVGMAVPARTTPQHAEPYVTRAPPG
jgi:hypothetical protein